MPSAKATVRAVLDQLPDDCSMEDVLYRLYVVQKVKAGLADVDADRLVPHEQVADEIRQMLAKGSAD
jgi:predicted transcriptional regulator